MTNNILIATAKNDIDSINNIIRNLKRLNQDDEYFDQSMRIAILNDNIKIVKIFIDHNRFSTCYIKQHLLLAMYNHREKIKHYLMEIMNERVLSFPCHECIVKMVCHNQCDKLRQVYYE